MRFLAHNKSAEPLPPGEQPFRDPAALMAAQRSAVLRLPEVSRLARSAGRELSSAAVPPLVLRVTDKSHWSGIV